MTPDRFRDLLDAPKPPAELTDPLRVLWFDKNGDWDAAHDIAQDLPDPDGALLHAYLHRVEGDLPNAGYWYRRAGCAEQRGPLDAEWETLVRRYTVPE